MLKQTLQFTQSILNQFLVNRFSVDHNVCILNPIIDATGSVPLQNQNKVIITLINIEQETAKPFYNRNQKLPSGTFGDVNPTERYNLDVLISANFDDYLESLKFLNESILFFQMNVYADTSTNSTLPQGLTKLEFDIDKLSYLQMHNLWTAMGAKYQPSVVYKIRLIALQGEQVYGYTPTVKNHNHHLQA